MPRKFTLTHAHMSPWTVSGLEPKALKAETKHAYLAEDVEPLAGALAEILNSCQEVAHEVDDPTQACAEIEVAARKALKAFEEDSE